MDLKEERILGDKIDSHWYHVSKNLALKKLIAPISFMSVTDIGAGAGFFSKKILEETPAQEAICVDVGYPKEENKTHFGKSLIFKKNIDSITSDLVLMMDVLEHIEDDIGFLTEHVNKTPPGTHFCITVPAFQFLFSTHDIFLGHHRRYTLKSLESCLKNSGLTILKSSYFFSLMFPLMAFVRLAKKIKIWLPFGQIQPKSDLSYPGKMINKILILVHSIELKFFPFNKLAGMSVFCLAIKK